MYGCAAKGVPCVMGTRVAAAALTGSDIANVGAGCVAGGGGGGGAGRDRRDETQRVGKDDATPIDEGMKYDCVRWTSGIEIRVGGGGSEGERVGDAEGEYPAMADSERVDVRGGCPLLVLDLERDLDLDCAPSSSSTVSSSTSISPASS